MNILLNFINTPQFQPPIIGSLVIKNKQLGVTSSTINIGIDKITNNDINFVDCLNLIRGIKKIVIEILTNPLNLNFTGDNYITPIIYFRMIGGKLGDKFIHHLNVNVPLKYVSVFHITKIQKDIDIYKINVGEFNPHK